MMRTVHWTKYKGFSLHLHRWKHVLFIVIPVSGCFIEIYGTDTRCHNMQVTKLSLFVFDIVFQLLPDCVSLWKKHWKSTSNQIIDHEQVHVFTDLSVISFLCFLEQLQMCLKFFRCRETYTINSLQYFVLAVTLPICTGMTDQFKVSAKLYIIYVRSTAQICEISLIINSDVAILQIRNQIQLVLIIFEHFHCFCLGNLTTDNLLSGFCHFLHFFFNLFDILVTDHIIPEIYVIIKSFGNNRSYPELCLWIQMLDCLCHQMCTRMIQCV